MSFIEDPIKSEFRNDSGRLVTRALFFEFTKEDKRYVKYTLKNIDWKGYPSLYRLYMEESDLTEYIFANKYFESWEHWLQVTQISEFKPYLRRWREELQLKTTAVVLASVVKEAKKGSFQANKILLDYAERLNEQTGTPGLASKPPRGRPSKQEVKNNLRTETEELQKLQEDLERLTNVTGNGESRTH